MKLVEMFVEGVALDNENKTLVLLVDSDRQRAMPIWIGPAEAMAIQLKLEHHDMMRPMSHDLMAELLNRVGDLVEVVIHDFTETIYYAKLVVETRNGTIQIDCRPSDGIALALRCRLHSSEHVPIYVSADVLAVAGSDWNNLNITDPAYPREPSASSHEIEQFIQLIEGVDLDE